MDRFKIKTAVYAIIEKEGKILLLKRSNTGWMDGKYTLPSGHIEEGETPLETVIREIKEEAGVTVKKGSLKLVHILYDTDAYIDFYFKASSYLGKVKLAEPSKSSEIIWEENIKRNNEIIPKVKACLINYSNGILFSEFSKSDGN